MKVGLDHSVSKEKRAFDIALSTLLLPAKFAGEMAVRRLIFKSLGQELEPIRLESRMGHKHEPFDLHKFVTCLPGTKVPIDDWAEIMQRYALDEVAQLTNIKAGQMSFIGPRPLDVAEYEATRDYLPPKLGETWDKILLVAKSGLYSSYGLYSHTLLEQDPNGPEIRAELDIKDAMETSFPYDIHLIGQLIAHAVAGRFSQP